MAQLKAAAFRRAVAYLNPSCLSISKHRLSRSSSETCSATCFRRALYSGIRAFVLS